MSGKKRVVLRKIIFVLMLTLTSSIMDAQEQKEEPANIYLNFENTSLESVVNYLAEQKNINFIPHKELKTKKVSLTTREPLSLSRAWNVLLTLLEMNDFSLINVDGVYRVVKNKENKREPLPFYSSNQGTMPKDLPDSDEVIRYVYILKNISTDDAAKILGDLLGRDKIRTAKELRTCIITDKSYNIKSAMKIIEELDTGGLRESIKMIKLNHTDAEEVAKLFSQYIFEKQPDFKKPIRFITTQQKKEISYFSSTTKIIPEVRQNMLILLGLEQNIDRIIDFISKRIDIPMEKAESRIHIKELKYVEAPTIEKILKQIVTPPKGKQKGPLVGEFKFFEDVVIESEKPESGEGDKKISKGSGNRIIIGCNKDDWQRLEKIIDKFDKPQPQVALEVMVIDIDDTKARELGSEVREKTGKSLAKGLTVYTTNLQEVTTADGHDANLINAAIHPSGATGGTTSIAVGRPGDVWAVIRSFVTTSNTNIISQPFLVTSSNEQCVYSSSEKRKIPGELKMKDGKSYLSQEDVRATTKVTITPRINFTGLVDLRIKITLNEFLAPGTSETPPKSNRVIETRANMATGEVLVLGGLTKDTATINKYKTPILGDIPILGNLFKSKTKSTRRTNLYVFIRPSIIKPKFGGGADEYTQLKLDYAKHQIFNAETLRHSKDPIERWFFRPDKQAVDERLKDLKKGVFRPIDQYTEGKTQPQSVRIEEDPYYRASEEIEKMKAKRKREEARKKAFREKFAKNQALRLPSLRKKLKDKKQIS